MAAPPKVRVYARKAELSTEVLSDALDGLPVSMLTNSVFLQKMKAPDSVSLILTLKVSRAFVFLNLSLTSL